MSLTVKKGLMYNFSSHIYYVPSLKGVGRHIVFDVDPVGVGMTLSCVEISHELVGGLEPNLHKYNIRVW